MSHLHGLYVSHGSKKVMNKETERKRAIQYVKKEIIALFSIFIYRGGELPTVLCAFPTGVPHTCSEQTPSLLPSASWLQNQAGSQLLYNTPLVKAVMIHCVGNVRLRSSLLF